MRIAAAFLDSIGLTGYDSRTVHGGSINQAFCLTHKGERYFLKINEAKRYPGMFAKEADALQILKKNTTLYVPGVIRVGEVDGVQYLLLEWMGTGVEGDHFRQQFGEGLAALHRHTQPAFGWHEENYIGSLRQSNTPGNSWSTFYANERVLPLVKQLFSSGQITQQDIKLAEKLCERLDDLFPKEPPALLHGDLWSGNFMVSTKGPAIFDPAVYYGHREMDIGMSLLFGGFDNEFYDAYESAWPLEKGWRQRVPLTQLYPLLVHACLFGGHYVSSCRTVMAKFVS